MSELELLEEIVGHLITIKYMVGFVVWAVSILMGIAFVKVLRYGNA